MSAKANGNLISDLTMPNRILYSINIAKGEYISKPKSHFRLDYAEPHPILAANAANIEKSSWRKKSSVSFFSFNTNSIILQKETLGSYTLSDTINRIRHDNC
ncbi:hypothetical protein [Barnesiella intestinihominis]|uniref:hypothetical protein n=1 Tax=Barnesiella intestinihominis TaxID=487174 RepID=UPI0039673CB3